MGNFFSDYAVTEPQGTDVEAGSNPSGGSLEGRVPYLQPEALSSALPPSAAPAAAHPAAEPPPRAAQPIRDAHEPPDHARYGAYIASLAQYNLLYDESVQNPDQFWGRVAKENLTWFTPFSQVRSGQFSDGSVGWFLNGTLNVSFNCLDRHLPHRADKIAIIAEGDTPDDVRRITYQEAFNEVCRLANVLTSVGVRKGDTVAVYMPNVPEALYAMLACARIGAVHSVVFGGFSAEALRDRIQDAACRVLITCDEGLRGGRAVHLKKIADDAVRQCPTIERVFVLKKSANAVPFHAPRDVWLREAMDAQRPYCAAVPLSAEDPLFLLYTSGSTGKPKGVMHTQAGYLLYAMLTCKYVFDIRDGDVFACMADVGWITGHSYIVYGPLANGSVTFMFESIPTYPNPGRYWDMVERHKINQIYLAPTAIRTLMKYSVDEVKKHDRSSLRVLGSVGEPINPEAWRWYHDVVGEKRCSIVDTYWQTESGGHLLTPLPGCTPQKPGSATLPFFGVVPVVLDATTGQPLEGNGVTGVLAIAQPWPSLARTVYGDHQRYLSTYMKPYPGYYFTGDGVIRDADGYYWITGRVDDVINVSGHRLGTAEIESALVSHPACAEAAVVGMPHEIKGQGIFAYCTLKEGFEESTHLVNELRLEIRKHIGPFASPDFILITPGLPKTRSGKIMRRILRKIACKESAPEQLGDISTLADPAIVQFLIDKEHKLTSGGTA